MSETILIVAAHPDDEALGCGGTIARHAAAGDRVEILFLTDGQGARGVDAAEQAAARRKMAEAAATALGAAAPHFEALPDNAIDTVPLLDVVRLIERRAADIRPSVVYTHHAGDLNIDHRIAQQAVLTAFRPQPGSSVRALYAFETPSATDYAGYARPGGFAPNRFVNIEATWSAKRAALEAYAPEMRPAPHSRSFEAVEALARWRGASVGLPMAEAFEVLRDLEG